MIKNIIRASAILILLYIGLVQFQLWLASKSSEQTQPIDSSTESKVLQKVYRFSFSKYDTNGKKELEIEGDSADILAKNILFTNVLAKAFAEDSPITITADSGVFDKTTNNVHLQKNVIATTNTGTRLLTEELEINPAGKTVETAVHAKVKRENIHVEGIGASGDSQLKKVNFKKNVTVVVQNLDTETKAPTIITCDGPLEIDYERNIAHFSQNVVAKDERGKLFADFMDVFYNQSTKKIYKIIATGNVIIINKDGHQTYSDNAIYLAEDGKIILGGDVEAVGAKESKKGSSSTSVADLFNLDQKQPSKPN
ncbi:MAG: LPS export ABC transporter periplasmic protein LptC [Candidatus Omnitrophica bacterium]|nr:LPS export ABC transporter periplasmic protein LptC [Candidatus Omnitrophota bacterium]